MLLFKFIFIFNPESSQFGLAECGSTRAGVEPGPNWVLLAGKDPGLQEAITGCDFTETILSVPG